MNLPGEVGAPVASLRGRLTDNYFFHASWQIVHCVMQSLHLGHAIRKVSFRYGRRVGRMPPAKACPSIGRHSEARRRSSGAN